MSIALHCDLTGCDTWARGKMTKTFITVLEGKKLVGHFCDLDHAMKHLASISEPARVINIEDM